MPDLRFAAGRYYLTGQATYATLDAVSQDLLSYAGKAGEMVIDLEKVTDCDSTLVAALAACVQVKKQHGGTLRVENAPSKFQSMLEVYGLLGSGLQQAQATA